MLTSRSPRALTSHSIRLSRTDRLKTGSPMAIMPISLPLWLSHTRNRSRRPKPLDTGTDHVREASRNRSPSHVSLDIGWRTEKFWRVHFVSGSEIVESFDDASAKKCRLQGQAVVAVQAVDRANDIFAGTGRIREPSSVFWKPNDLRCRRNRLLSDALRVETVTTVLPFFPIISPR